MSIDDFHKLMRLLEERLNSDTQKCNSLYKDCEGQKLESVIVDELRTIAAEERLVCKVEQTPKFSFPDIEIDGIYGVEVKTTNKDHWTSTGSSIIESTRKPNIIDVYLLFGKLGGERAEFLCKPYGNCLSEIAVTHSPRYRINMTLPNNENILSKMGIQYDNFRKLDDREKIETVKRYYTHVANGKEMPWWMGSDESDTVPINLKLYGDVENDRKNEIITTLYILFPEIFDSNYERVILYLCSNLNIVCKNVRDLFTSGGSISKLGDKQLADKAPQIILQLYNLRYKLLHMLREPPTQLLQDIKTYWNIVVEVDKIEHKWIELAQDALNRNNKYKTKYGKLPLIRDVLYME